MNNEDKLQFRTSDLALASALTAVGFSLNNILKSSSGRASFIFLWTKELQEVIDIYWSDSMTVNPKVYFDSLKHLKTRLYSGSQQ